MGGKTTSTSATKLNGISVQSSSLGLPLSMGWGRGRMKCNLIWYGAFTATPHTTTTGGGKGFGAKSKNTTYTYTASLILALGEGIITGIRTVYRDTSVFTSLSAAGLSFANGDPNQPVWGYLTSKFPSQAQNYSGISYVNAQDYDLGDSGALPNHSFEVDFAIQLGGGVCDADPKDILTDFLTSASHGVPGWTSGLIGDLSDWSLYCRANNLLLSPVLESQSTASDIITEWCTATNSAPFWSEGVLKVKPYGDTAATGNSVTWTPNLTPIYDLDEDDFGSSDDGAPVKLNIVDQSDAYNIVQIEYLDRANQYNTAIAPAQDLANIVEFGPRKQDPTSLHCICDAGIAQHAAQLLLQRTLYIREQYQFTLPWNFVLLEPGDYVTLTTTTDALQLNRVLVRITEIKEDEDGLLAFTAEGVPVGTASAALYASHSGTGYQSDSNVAPGSVSAPLLFIAPTQLTGFNPEVWLAAASTSPTWGGCQVWTSTDATSYSMVGTVDGPARYGTITATLPGHADPDNTNTLSVDLSTSLGQLDSVSASDKDLGVTLAVVGDEVVSYQTATLTSAYHYNLTSLRRALRDTTAGAHSSGTAFARLDDAIFKFGYDPTAAGDTIYVKLVSFNIYGRGLEDIAAVTAYSINISSAQGRFAYRDTKFQRAFARPATPTGDNPAGWFDSIPDGDGTIWQVFGDKDINKLLIGGWSTPQATQGLTARGAYDAGATYYVDNTVTYGGGTYVATQDSFSAHAPSGTDQANAYWDVIAAPGSPGTPATPPSAFSATINLTSGAAINLRTLADAAGYTGLSDATVNFVVPNGVTIQGLAGGGIGIDTGTWPSSSYTITLTLTVQSGGLVLGGGGNGGDGGGWGGNGGDAIYCRENIGVTINSGGVVRAAGGGGGGESFASPWKFGADGGGGGSPNGNGGTAADGSITSGVDGHAAVGATPGAKGGAGAGDGGTWATDGASGTGGAGGAAGYAVRKNGKTVPVSNSGTMTGTAA